MRAPRTVELRTIEACIIDTIARGAEVDAFALMVLLHGYRASGRDDLRQALEPALSRALVSYDRDVAVNARGAWLMLFADAIALSDDGRLPAAALRLMAELQGAWNDASSVERAAAAIEACLRASDVLASEAPEAAAGGIGARAIDALEALVARSYAPGLGMLREPLPGASGHSDRAATAVRGGLGDQVRASSALLAAYDLSGRLPYSMLAEELMQQAGLRSLGDDFVLNCEAARVLGRLAVLHDDARYRTAAVIAPGADYRRDAERILTAQASPALRRGADGAIYALALLELEFADWYAD